MKRTLHVLVPLLLTLAVICCALWYLLVYDRAFTRDVLLYHARTFEEYGNHKLAAKFYDLAYYQSGEEDEIAIELAEQYISSGNYTKAEYTLSKAISDNPTAKLYIALCQTYVAQDKLMDAVAILDTIADPIIKAELDAQRPAVPTATPAPDFYSQYISVEILSNVGPLYVSTVNQYPSAVTDAYTGAIELPIGETMIYALAVNDQGLVSPLGVFGYTVGGIIEEVVFSDAAMEAAIRSELGIDESTPVFTNDLWAITEFTVPEDAAVYSDLAYLQYLKSLTIINGVESELPQLVTLRELTELHLINCRPDEELLTAIAALPYLKALTLRDCGLSTIAPLSGALELEYLDLSDNSLRNVTPLSGMTKLEELYLNQNALTELSALSSASSLQVLEVSHNSITTLEPISHLTGLLRMDVSYNKLTSLGDLCSTGLTYLSAEHNSISDVSVLSACTELQQLYLSTNQLTDITMLSPLSKLEHFEFAYNQVTALPAFDKSCPLVTIDGSYNLLVSLEELADLDELNNVLMDYNAELEDLMPLDSCNCLILVNVYGTKVTEVNFLTDKSVIVNFNPVLNE